MEKQKTIIGFIRIILNVMWYLGVLGAAVAIIVFFVLGISVDVAPGQKVNMTYKSSSRSVMDISVSSTDTKKAEVTISPGAISFGADVNFFKKSRFFMIPMVILFLAMIFMLRGLFNDLHAKKSPFIIKNSFRIRWVGICVIAGAFTMGILDFIVGKYIAENIDVANVSFSYGFYLRFDMIFIGLIILVLSEIFRHGHQLEKEQELTI